MADQKSGLAGYFRRAADWLKKQLPGKRTESVVILPKRAVCFHGALALSFPADFHAESREKDQLLFTGQKSGLQMTVMRMPFSRPLREVTAADLQISFRKLLLPSLTPKLEYGYLRHSPTLTAYWVHPPAKKKLRRGTVNVTLEQSEEKTVLHLIQVRRTVYLLLFRHVTAELDATVNAMIYSVSADPEKAGQ